MTLSYATNSPKSLLAPFLIERREPGPYDVLVDNDYCGVCHSDIHQARNEWGDSTYPMVSSCGSIRQTHEMLDFSAKHDLSANVEMVKVQEINQAFERTQNGDVRYQFVSDLDSLRQNAS